MSVRQKANPNAWPKNMIVLAKGETGCCGDSTTVCMYDLVLSAAMSATAVVVKVNGTNTTKNFTVTATTEKMLRVELAKVFDSLGYDAYYEDEYKSFIIKNRYVAVVGDVELVSLTNNGSAVNFVKKCNKGSNCVYYFQVGSLKNPGTVKLGIASAVQIATTSGWDAGTETVANVKTAMETAFASAGITATNVNVVKDTNYFYMTFNLAHSPEEVAFTNTMHKYSCGENFIA